MTIHHRGGADRLRFSAAPLALLALCPALAVAQTTTAPVTEAPTIKIEAATIALPAATVSHPGQGTQSPAADAAEYLMSLPGVSGGRIGSHATEISIRGQSQDRLAIINDGSFTFGACPNRMDPPTSTAALESTDIITVKRGYQSVVDGPPAPGGTVSMERLPPAFTEFASNGSLSGGIESNGGLRFGAADITAGTAEGYVRASAAARKADNYEDGSGRAVRSAFEQSTGSVEGGWTYAPGSVLSLAVERDLVSDAVFAGTGMDAPFSGTTTYRAKWRHELDGSGMLAALDGGLYVSKVDHRMDNYSLRPLTAPMKMMTSSESDTLGGRITADLTFGSTDLTVGLDHRTNTRDAVMYSGMAMMAGDPATVSGYLWPDIDIADTGLFAEAMTPLGTTTVLTTGARLDLVNVDAGKADALPAGMGAMTARQIYAQYYGETDVSRNEANISGLLRVDHGFGGGLDGWVGISRAVRTADATERGMARNAGANSWIGNPAIAPEKHHQIDAGVSLRGNEWGIEVAGWGDWVNDFISRDEARGQDGVLMANGASIYRNVDAIIAGVELGGDWRPAPEWRLAANATYTWGDNTTDNRPLYQIPPFQGMVEAAWEPGDWGVGSRLRWAVTQTRVDEDTATGSGLDTRKTPGYGAVDLFTSYAGFDGLELRAGVNNLFDQTYANHLSRSNGVDPVMVQVNDPGRSFYLQGRVNF